MGTAGELNATDGFVAPDVREEFPGLRVRSVRLDGPVRPSPDEVKARLRSLSDRFHGPAVVAMRTRPVHHAYRAFFRQIGLDPDVQRPPAEEAAMSRLLRGGLSAPDALRGALLIALVETGVPVWALDRDLVHPNGIGIRQTHEGDRLGEGHQDTGLLPGRLVVADARCVHALLFGELAPGHEAGPRTKRIVLFSIGVEGVPTIHLEEALWLSLEMLRALSRDGERARRW